jgi:hypothetical protein
MDRTQRKRVEMVKNVKMVENLRTLDDGEFGKRRRGRGWPASKRVKRKETKEVDKAKMHHFPTLWRVCLFAADCCCVRLHFVRSTGNSSLSPPLGNS